MIKKINRYFYNIVFISFGVALLLISLPAFSDWTQNKEAFIFFPEDETIFFKHAKSSIELLNKKDDDEYVLNIAFSSETNKPAFLRKDMSLLFENGTFVHSMKESLKDQLFIEEVGTYDGEDSGRFDSITFHHAETHYSNEQINSKFTWSSDQLYVADSPFSLLHSFHEPSDQNEEKDKEILDSILMQQLSYELDGLLEEFHINGDYYHAFTLLDLPNYQEVALPGLTEKETYATLGKIWESLYRFYVLGINTFTEETYSPYGNSIPHILLHKDGTHLLLLYETKDGSKQQLLQLIQKLDS